jgi:hypothetical protein
MARHSPIHEHLSKLKDTGALPSSTTLNLNAHASAC